MIRTGGRRSCGIGCLTLVVVLVPVAGSYYTVVNRIPPAPQISVALPRPNARDAYLEARPFLPKQLPIAYSVVEELPDSEIRTLVGDGRKALSCLRRGLQMSYAAPAVTSMLTPLDDMKVLRDLAKIQLAKAQLEERRGNTDSAVAEYLNVLKYGAQISHGPTLQNGLVPQFMQRAALRGIERLTNEMDGPLALNTVRALEAVEERTAKVGEVLRNDELSTECAIIEIMLITRSGSQPEHPELGDTPPWASRFDLVNSLTSKEKMLVASRRYSESVRRVAVQPFWKRGRFPVRPSDPVNQWFAIPLEDAVFPFDVTLAYFRLVQVKLAARAYRKKHNRDVSNVVHLAPEFVTTVQDPFSGMPMRLMRDRVTGRQIIYSVGPDMEDDGGHPAERRFWRDAGGDLPQVLR